MSNTAASHRTADTATAWASALLLAAQTVFAAAVRGQPEAARSAISTITDRPDHAVPPLPLSPSQALQQQRQQQQQQRNQTHYPHPRQQPQQQPTITADKQQQQHQQHQQQTQLEPEPAPEPGAGPTLDQQHAPGRTVRVLLAAVIDAETAYAAAWPYAAGAIGAVAPAPATTQPPPARRRTLFDLGQLLGYAAPSAGASTAASAPVPDSGSRTGAAAARLDVDRALRLVMDAANALRHATTQLGPTERIGPSAATPLAQSLGCIRAAATAWVEARRTGLRMRETLVQAQIRACTDAERAELLQRLCADAASVRELLQAPEAQPVLSGAAPVVDAEVQSVRWLLRAQQAAAVADFVACVTVLVGHHAVLEAWLQELQGPPVAAAAGVAPGEASERRTPRDGASAAGSHEAPSSPPGAATGPTPVPSIAAAAAIAASDGGGSHASPRSTTGLAAVGSDAAISLAEARKCRALAVHQRLYVRLRDMVGLFFGASLRHLLSALPVQGDASRTRILATTGPPSTLAAPPPTLPASTAAATTASQAPASPLPMVSPMPMGTAAAALMDAYTRLAQQLRGYQRRTDAVNVSALFHTDGLLYRGTGFAIVDRASYEPPTGIGSYPSIFSCPQDRVPLEHLPNIIRFIVSHPIEQGAKLPLHPIYFCDRAVPCTYYLMRVNARTTLVIVHGGRRPESDATTVGFVQEMTTALRLLP